MNPDDFMTAIEPTLADRLNAMRQYKIGQVIENCIESCESCASLGEKVLYIDIPAAVSDEVSEYFRRNGLTVEGHSVIPTEDKPIVYALTLRW